MMTSPRTDRTDRTDRATVVVTSTASDAHTWNLVYLQLVIEESGHHVVNLGACVPDRLLLDECRRTRPELVVISSVNGHGFNDGLRLGPLLRGCPELADTMLVIGGKLAVDGLRSVSRHRQLLDAGFDRVFDGGDVTAFRALLGRFTARAAS